MKMEIASRYKPFSHLRGESCLIPGSVYSLVSYPTKVLLQKHGKTAIEISLDITGPVKNFTTMLDLEKGRVSVFGTAKEGYFHFWFYHDKHYLIAELKRSSQECIALHAEVFDANISCQTSSNSKIALNRKEKLVYLVPESSFGLKPKERLSFGVHKKQDFELVKKRSLPEEYFPIWHRLAQYFPKNLDVDSADKESLIHKGFCCLEEGKSLELLETLENLFATAFSSILLPKAWDDEFQGIDLPYCRKIIDHVPVEILTKGADLIRSFFIQKKWQTLSVLPSLPAKFHCGSLLGVEYNSVRVDTSWSKKMIKKLRVFSFEDQSLTLKFQKGVKSCRMRSSVHEKGVRIDLNTLGEIDFKKDRSYFFDRFES